MTQIGQGKENHKSIQGQAKQRADIALPPGDVAEVDRQADQQQPQEHGVLEVGRQEADPGRPAVHPAPEDRNGAAAGVRAATGLSPGNQGWVEKKSEVGRMGS